MIESKLSESDKGTEKEASEEPIKKKKRFLGYGLSDVDEEREATQFDAEKEMEKYQQEAKLKSDDDPFLWC